MDVLKFLTVSDRNHLARDADVAQVVAHLIGNEEVGSSSLLVSSWKKPVTVMITGFFGVYRILEFACCRQSMTV